MLVKQLLSIISVNYYTFVDGKNTELINESEEGSYQRIKQYYDREVQKAIPGNNSLILVLKDSAADDTYVLVENRNVGFAGHPQFEETELFSGTMDDCSKAEAREKEKYKMSYGDDYYMTVDCHLEKKAERDAHIKYNKALKEYAATLSEEEKKELVEINGNVYRKYILDFKKQYEGGL